MRRKEVRHLPLTGGEEFEKDCIRNVVLWLPRKLLFAQCLWTSSSLIRAVQIENRFLIAIFGWEIVKWKRLYPIRIDPEFQLFSDHWSTIDRFHPKPDWPWLAPLFQVCCAFPSVLRSPTKTARMAGARPLLLVAHSLLHAVLELLSCCRTLCNPI